MKKEKGVLTTNGEILCVPCRLKDTHLRVSEIRQSDRYFSDDDPKFSRTMDETYCDQCDRTVYVPIPLAKERALKKQLIQEFEGQKHLDVHILDSSHFQDLWELKGDEILSPHRVFVVWFEHVVCTVHFKDTSVDEEGKITGYYVLETFYEDEFRLVKTEEDVIHVIYKAAKDQLHDTIYIQGDHPDEVVRQVKNRLEKRGYYDYHRGDKEGAHS